jgi:hypothetical protein
LFVFVSSFFNFKKFQIFLIGADKLGFFPANSRYVKLVAESQSEYP